MNKPVEQKPLVVERKTRRERPPIEELRDILSIKDMDPNYSYRWVANRQGRIEKLEARGWEVVKDNLQVGDKTVDSPSGKLGSALTRFGGSGLLLVAMRIPKEWYDEDQERKQEAVDALEDSMRDQADEYTTRSETRRDTRPVLSRK